MLAKISQKAILVGMIAEFGPDDYLEGARESFNSSLVVVRGFLDEDEVERIRKFVPEVGKKRVYTRPQLWRPLNSIIEKSRMPKREVGRLLRSELGALSTLYLQRPDILRRGDVAPHVDDRTIALSTSVNLDVGEAPTILKAQRVTEGNVPYAEIEAAWSESGLRSVHDLTDEIDLGVGDAVIIGRGVVHSSVTGIERESIVIRTRGIIR